MNRDNSLFYFNNTTLLEVSIKPSSLGILSKGCMEWTEVEFIEQHSQCPQIHCGIMAD